MTFGGPADMPVAARRVFRLALTVALALACGYGMALDVPFLPPIFALMLAAPPGLPMPAKKLLVLVLAVMLILALGLLLIRPLEYAPLSAVLVVACGLFLASHMSINLGQGQVAMILTLSLTLISAMGTQSWALAVAMIHAVALSLIVAIVSQWVVYPFFPEAGHVEPAAAPEPTAGRSRWLAVRATAVILPAYLLMLTNPAAYAPIVMKSVSLGQQTSMISAREAGRELLTSTFLGGCFAILLWFALGIVTNLWMFFLWMLLFGIYYGGKLYQVFPSRFPPTFWSNVVITALILLGFAVQDSNAGKDVYQAFAVRMGLFLVVTVYAWGTLYFLEQWRVRRGRVAAPVSS